MATLPVPGQDNETWGDKLNTFVSVALDPATGAVRTGSVAVGQLAFDPATQAELDAHIATAIFGDDASGTRAVASFDGITKSGHYVGNNATGAPVAGSGVWCHLIHNERLAALTPSGALQLAARLDATDPTLYMRQRIGTAWGPWNRYTAQGTLTAIYGGRTTGAQTFAVGANKLTYNSVTDALASGEFVNSTFTAKTAGRYRFTAYVSVIMPTAGTRGILSLVSGGTATELLRMADSTSVVAPGYFGLTGSVEVDLALNATVDFSFNLVNNSATGELGGAVNWCEVSRVVR